MAAGAHDGGGGFGQTAGARTARGIAVIAVAVLVGLVLMFQGLGDDETAADGTQIEAGETDGSTTIPAEGGDPAPTDSATGDTVATDTTVGADVVPVTARPPIEVTVLVLNGTNGIKGAAGRGTAIVETAGYSVATAADADVDGPSLVLYTEGYEADANAVAAVYGVDASLVVQPFDPAASPVADTQGANIIVRVGNDGLIQV